jgi:hypothetical protein
VLGPLSLLASLWFGPPAGASEDPPLEPDLAHERELGAQLEVVVGVRGSRDQVVGARLFVVPSDPSGAPARAEAEPHETDARGRAELELEPGRYTLTVRADGYEPRELAVELTAGERTKVSLLLDEAIGGNRYRTVVESERATAITRTTLRDEAIHALPGSGGDPFAVVRSLPGAAQVAGFLPYVVVRGAAPGNTGYYLDGIRVPALFHVAIGPSVVHPYFIDEVDFYAGGVPVRLGRYASGIVEGRTRAAGRARGRGEVDLRLTDTGALLEIPFDRPRDRACEDQVAAEIKTEGLTGRAARAAKATCVQPGRGALTIGGRYSYAGLILSAIPGLNVKLRYWDYQARLDHDLGRRARYTAFVFGSYDELGPRQAVVDVVDEDAGIVTQELDQNPDPYLRFEFHRIDQRIRQRLGARGRIDYALAFGLDRSGVQGVRVDEWRVVPRIDAQLELGEHTTLGLGLDQEFQVFRLPSGLDPSALTGSVEDLGLLLSERFVSVTGLYLDLAYRYGALELRPGVRADLWAQVGASPYLPGARTRVSAFGVDPRLLMREQVGQHIALRQSIGLYHQAPDPPIPIPGVESIGLESGLQRNLQASVGWEWALADLVVLTQDLYGGRLSNMQDYELSEGLGDDDSTSADELDDYLIRVDGWAWGLETMLRLIPDGKAYGWVAYTLAWSIRDYPLGGYAPATWDQRHILNAVVGWNINRKWRLGGRLHVNSGRPYTARRVDAEGNLETLVEALTKHRNDSRLPAFMQLDARVERIFSLADFRLHLYLDLANANFAREVLRCDSLAEGQSAAVQVLDGCVNPQAVRYILPSLGLRAVF